FLASSQQFFQRRRSLLCRHSAGDAAERSARTLCFQRRVYSDTLHEAFPRSSNSVSDHVQIKCRKDFTDLASTITALELATSHSFGQGQAMAHVLGYSPDMDYYGKTLHTGHRVKKSRFVKS